MNSDLINYVTSPNAPAPLNSQDEGESWVWGNYFAVLQTAPLTVYEVVCQQKKEKIPLPPSIRYAFALSVYYQNSKSPHGMTTRPLLIAALAKVDDESGTAVRMIRGSVNMNRGMFQGPITRERARERLFSEIARALSLEGEPMKIGSIEEIHGHPNTGWPARKTKKSSGCLNLLLLTLALLSCVVVSLVQK
jgi:hypothetical protein